MNNQHTKRTTATIAASVAALTGAGLVAAAMPAQATPATRTVSAPAASVASLKAPARSSVIVYRGGVSVGKSSIKAAPKAVQAKKKKAKKRYRSRRS